MILGVFFLWPPSDCCLALSTHCTDSLMLRRPDWCDLFWLSQWSYSCVLNSLTCHCRIFQHASPPLLLFHQKMLSPWLCSTPEQLSTTEGRCLPAVNQNKRLFLFFKVFHFCEKGMNRFITNLLRFGCVGVDILIIWWIDLSWIEFCQDML